jgi:hypothetical protein
VRCDYTKIFAIAAIELGRERTLPAETNGSVQRRQANLATTSVVFNRPLHLNGYAAFFCPNPTIIITAIPQYPKRKHGD